MNDLQILITTLLGTLLVLVAVWLIAVRRDPERNTAKIFGIELDLSTPGIVVLLAGCGLLALPGFVPHRPGGMPSFGWSAGGPAPAGREPPIVLQQQTVLASEQEPNDSVGSANIIELGQTIEGTLVEAENPADYFALATTPETRGPKRIIVRTRGPASGCFAILTVWNEKEEEIGGDNVCIGGTISDPVQPADAYLMRLAINTGGYEVMNYELVAIDDR